MLRFGNASGDLSITFTDHGPAGSESLGPQGQVFVSEPVRGPLAANDRVRLEPNAAVRAAVQRLGDRVVGGGQARFVPGAGNAATVVDAGIGRTATIAGQAVAPLDSCSTEANAAGIGPGSGGTATVMIDYLYELPAVVQPVILVATPLPAAGGVVGRNKIAENNSPFPRDRFVFNYDYFDQARIATGGTDVHRFSPGVEKTFYGGWTSIELRMPFASTLAGEFVRGMETEEVEFGNVFVNLKALVSRSPELAVSTGLGISLPTAPDTNVLLDEATPLVRIENESLLLTPYVAAAWTPDDRLFSQSWSQVGFDVSGSPVSTNPSLAAGGNLVGAGELSDQILLSLDTQVGYWVVREGAGALRGLAPFVELHYNTTLDDAVLVRSGDFTVGNVANKIDEVTLTLGATALVGDRLQVAAGYVTPLRGGADRFFDSQFGIRASYYFGNVLAAARPQSVHAF